MHGPTCIFWANLTPFSLQIAVDVAKAGTAGYGGLVVLDYENWFLQWATRWQESFNGPFQTVRG